jgi:hypothetical protein
MNRDELASFVLSVTAERCAEVQSRPRPPDWRVFEIERYEADQTLGPEYSPQWFGGVTQTEAGSRRVLRTIYKLSDAGLLTIFKSEGGRLERVRMTRKGLKAVKSIRNQDSQSESQSKVTAVARSRSRPGAVPAG